MSESDKCECPDPNKYDVVLDDVRSVIMDLCASMSAIKGLRFVVLGFDLDPWPTMVDPDLAVVLEQLPDVLAALRRGESGQLDFYEQGIERSIRFSVGVDDSSLLITCTSIDGRAVHPDRVVMRRQDAIAMLWELGSSFLKVASRLCPQTLTHPSMSKWASSLDQ